MTGGQKNRRIYPMSDKAERVSKYHSQLSTIRIRFPTPEVCGIDYATLIRERAKQLGFINNKGKDKGEGSANAYILHLIEQDLQIKIQKGLTDNIDI